MKRPSGRKMAADSLLNAAVHAAAGTLRATMTEHLEWLAVKGFSSTTLNARASLLVLFCRWCEERGLTRPGEVTRTLLERYQRHLFHFRRASGRPLSAWTQAQRLIAVRQYFRWACKHGLLEANPASELELPRRGERLPTDGLSIAQVEAVLAVSDVSTVAGLRDRAMMELLWACGLRRAEVIALRPYDVREESGVVVVKQGKGKKDRVVPIGARALSWVERYVRDARPRLVVPPDLGLLFLSEHGEAMHKDFFTRVVRQCLDAAGVKVRGGCHLLRHACATHMLEGGADVRYVQELLGHASLETTQLYTRVTINTLKAVYQAAHPAARDQQKKGPGEEKPNAAELLEALEAEAANEAEI
jgi:integrase/recombinase XerD